MGEKRRNEDNSRKKFFNVSREREAREEKEIKADKEIRRKGKRKKMEDKKGRLANCIGEKR